MLIKMPLPNLSTKNNNRLLSAPSVRAAEWIAFYAEAVQLQLEFAKSSYSDFVAHATKIGELYSNLAKGAFKPVETAVSRLRWEVHLNPDAPSKPLASNSLPRMGRCGGQAQEEGVASHHRSNYATL
jgi:hypothetical protein